MSKHTVLHVQHYNCFGALPSMILSNHLSMAIAIIHIILPIPNIPIVTPRRAYELAWATGFQFLGTRPIFVEVDEITFKRPVDVGDLLRLRSRVLWAAPKTTDPSQAIVHVQVVASVSQPEAVKSDITNTFVFVFVVDVDRVTRGMHVCVGAMGMVGMGRRVSPGQAPAPW